MQNNLGNSQCAQVYSIVFTLSNACPFRYPWKGLETSQHNKENMQKNSLSNHQCAQNSPRSVLVILNVLRTLRTVSERSHNSLGNAQCAPVCSVVFYFIKRPSLSSHPREGLKTSALQRKREYNFFDTTLATQFHVEYLYVLNVTFPAVVNI